MRKTSAAALILVILLGGIVLFFASDETSRTGFWGFVGGSKPLRAWTPATPSPTLKAPSAKPQNCGLLNVTVLDVGQADAIFIKTPGGKTILIDAGIYGRAANILKSQKIDYFVATHLHQDHIDGFKYLEKNVGAIYDNGDCGGNKMGTMLTTYEGFWQTHPHVAVTQDSAVEFDPCISVEFKVAYDRPQGCWTSNENENSILVRITYGSTSFLFAGDCEKNCEYTLLQQGTDLDAEFLKVGHHGSGTSSSADFVRAVGAQYYAISVNASESITKGYFHPRKASLTNIFGMGGFSEGTRFLYRTDLNGNLNYVSDGKTIRKSAYLTSPTLTEEFSGYSDADASTYGPIN
ncbi:Metallo-beta-lactamase superfamily protein [Candidatus Norongarragalina meridionalis]|nr:Metallo-beta-lactamase superfamily protein [Candidatus Norongarragalina meridionalis]